MAHMPTDVHIHPDDKVELVAFELYDETDCKKYVAINFSNEMGEACLFFDSLEHLLEIVDKLGNIALYLTEKRKDDLEIQ